MKDLAEYLKEDLEVNESLKNPDKNYLDEDSIRKFWIPDTEMK